MIDLFKMIFILFLFIGGCLFAMWLIKQSTKKQALNNTLKITEDMKQALKQSFRSAGVSTKDRLKHVMRSTIIGTVVYIFILVVGIIKGVLEDNSFDLKTYLLGSLVILAFIVLLIIKDILKVAPWQDVYRIKALPSLSVHGQNHAIYVCYYDFVKGEFVADTLPDTTSLAKVATSPEGFIDVLVIVGKRRLKLIDIIK